MMGYKTSYIDRLAKEEAMFIDYYSQQRCTTGRAAFTTGQRLSGGKWYFLPISTMPF